MWRLERRGFLPFNPRMLKAVGSHLCHQVERTQQGLTSTQGKLRGNGKKRKGGRQERKKGKEKRWGGGEEGGIEERSRGRLRERKNQGDGMVGRKEEGRSRQWLNFLIWTSGFSYVSSEICALLPPVKWVYNFPQPSFFLQDLRFLKWTPMTPKRLETTTIGTFIRDGMNSLQKETKFIWWI